MAINGIESVLYGVNDVAECTRYFVDFGLHLVSQSPDFAHFRLDEGSNVFIRHIGDKAIPQSCLVGTGACEVTWGVDRQESFDALIKDLQQDRPAQVHLPRQRRVGRFVALQQSAAGIVGIALRQGHRDHEQEKQSRARREPHG